MRKLWVSISGGLTSAYMAIKLKQEYSDRYELKFVYSNTGLEHEETLKFLDGVDRKFDLDIVWVEAVINPIKNKGTTHKVVSFDTCSRKGEPFEEMIKVYGVPNASYPHCNREMKIQVMNDYVKSIGWKDEFRAIGIRMDETHRLADDAGKKRIIYPLVDFFPVEKEDIIDWFDDKDYTLKIPNYLGNCVTCWKKSTPKLMRIMREDAKSFDFFDRMEKEHGLSGSNKDGTKRVFFRDHRSVKDLIAFEHATPELDFESNDRCANEECGLE